MIYNWLSQFWNSITSVGTYTIEFFQNIGNAVAGAMGGVLEAIFHTTLDFFISIWYLTEYVIAIFKNLLAPILYIFNFIKSIFINLTTPVDEVPAFQFNAEALELLNKVPNFSLILTILGGILCLLGIIAIIKVLASE